MVMVRRDETSSVRDWEPNEREFSTSVQQNPWTWGDVREREREREGEGVKGRERGGGMKRV